MTDHARNVRGLDDPTAVDVEISGAKGAGLARARAAGFPVLDGFVIPPGCSAPALEQAVAALEARRLADVVRTARTHDLLGDTE